MKNNIFSRPLYVLLGLQFLVLNIFAQAPTITSFTPSSGSVGSLVSITGTNLGSPTAFTIGGTAAIVISNTGTSLVGMVMPGAATGTISLTTAGGSVTSAGTFTLSTALAPNAQQGAKLVGTGNTGAANQGYSVSVSADGNTSIVGAWADNAYQGAAWIFTRSGTTWSQQGTKLVGTGNIGAARQGQAVSLSADGNTAIVGGWADNGNQGAVWIFTRSGTTWSQQGAKLVGTGNTGAAVQGRAVSLSADGNTAIVGGWSDNSEQGAAWIFTRSGTTWSQQGSKLVGTGNTGAAQQGISVSLNADGNTAIVGGRTDNSNQGAAWIFTRSGTTWSQQGAKLAGTGNTGAAQQGIAVSLNADGNTAIVGGWFDNSEQGATWIYTRTGTTWSQQGTKLVGTENTGTAQQGYSVSVSADGNTAIVGGLADNSNQGAAWIFTRSGTTWSQQGTKRLGTGNTGAARQGISVSLSADGTTSILGGDLDNISNGAAWVYTYVPPPTITSFTPASGPIGTLVTLTGANLNTPTAISIGGKPAIVISNTGTSLVAMVMPEAATGAISVSTAGGTATAAGNFTITATQYPTVPQSSKLVGTGAIGTSRIGFSVAISADGNTAVAGGDADNTNQGAAWIYKRIAGVWTEEAKLTGTGNIGAANQGFAVAISADGNTVLIGGYADNANTGATWVFTRTGGIWTQEAKLIGTGISGTPFMGTTVAISADGNTAMVAGRSDNSNQGAVWVFTRTANTWSQQGNKLTGTGLTGTPLFGTSISINADGNTAVIGARGDASSVGAALIFTKTGSNWTQQGTKLVGSGAVGAARFGHSASISADGNTVLIGGNEDNTRRGAVWIFTRTGSTWTQQGPKLTTSLASNMFGTSVSLSADGNIAMIGMPGLSTLYSGTLHPLGSAKIFTRSGQLWTEQMRSFPANGGINTYLSFSSSISADGSTAILGGPYDTASQGSLWAFSASPGPLINSFSPLSGSPGTLVTISGSNLENPTALSIGGKSAIVISNSGTSLVAMVMPGASTGPISITRFDGTGGTVTTSGNFNVMPIYPPNSQQGTKLVGTGNNGNSRQGASISISADGNTAAVGAPADNASNGAVWIYTRTSGIWTQQSKLVGTSLIGAAQIGTSVSISANGNTVIAGGSGDNGGIGATWVFERSSGVWSQQSKLIGTGNTGNSQQGKSVSISADGNTALVGASADNTNQGAGWIFTRANGIWTQSTKLVATGNTGPALQGSAVSISADGTTALLGGPSDNTTAGATWVFSLSVGTWSQQAQLLGTGGINALQGSSLALSADGNMAIIGGASDNSNEGAAWIFTRSGASWSQQGTKLLGTGAVGAAKQGNSVAINADGSMVLMGGNQDNGGLGATWTFTRSGVTWTQQGTKITGTGNSGNSAQGTGIALSANANTAFIGGQDDGSNLGAAWAFHYLNPTPTISSFSPTSAGSGNIVTITGTNLTDAFTLNFNGIAASSFTVGSATSITATVPSGAASGSINVTTPGGTASLAGFTVAAPTISSFSPDNGPIGTLVTVTGSNLGGQSAFTIGGTNAIVVSNSGTSLVALVMPGAITGGVSITTGGGTANATGNFTIKESNVPNTQQGAKLLANNNVGAAQQGYSLAISADGNTAAVGGLNDNGAIGATWIYIRSGSTWSQQAKLIGTGNTGVSRQGRSVAISADGNTVLVGGNADNSTIGAAWVFTRTGTNWTQQGNKLVGTGYIGIPHQGFSVSLSADGNTAIVGGRFDNFNHGAAWIYARSGGVWTQQGNKLVPSDPSAGNIFFGYAVSMSSDGNTAVVGGYGNNSLEGATWIFTKNNGTWSQQGSKLVGTGNTGASQQGFSVAINADGNTVIIGGNTDNTNQGATWVFARTGLNWTQQGTKLIGSGNAGTAQQGSSVSLSADGNTALIGAITDDTNKGATWTFRRNSGSFSQSGTKLIGGAAINAEQGNAVAISANGSTTLIGGLKDNSNEGAAWAFTVQPAISNFLPSSAASGTTVTITGVNFNGTTAVSFGGTAATSFNVVSATSITAVLAAGTSGNVSVTTADGTAVLAGFTFIPAPVITSFTPTSAATGATVTLTGTDFTGATAVSFGTTTATSFNLVSATSITAVVAAGTSGNVSVTTPGGTGTLAGFTFIPAPVITSFTPTSTGSTTTVSLTGSNFTGATAVSFGGTAATTFNVVSATSITAVVASGTSGNVSVTTPGGTGVLAGFTFIPAPVIASFTPTSAATGATVTLTGTNFTGATAVSFGGTAANSFNVVSATSITAVVAAGTSGNVSVTTPGGTGTLAGFTFIPAPVITSFTPTSAATGATVTITGTDFTGATAVSFGGTAATSFNVVSATSITAVVAAGTSGNISVTTPGGTGTLAGFTFIPAPVIASFTPTSAGSTTTVTLTGTNFTGATAVSFGGTAATSFNVVSATSITAVVAAGTSGNISVATPGGTGVIAGFTFIPAPVITSFTPTSASIGATVTLTGTNFTGATAVSFSGTAATSFNVVSATSITAVLAAGTSGNVSVTTPGGTGVLAGFTFIPAPVIASFTPTSGSIGATVTLTGTNFTGATAVSFGGTAATSFNVVSATSITAVVAAGTSGNVSVTTPGGTGTLAGFIFIPAPVIASFTPTSTGSTTTVTLTGTNFTGATAVSFGGTAATSFNVVSATSITAVVAAGTSGTTSVTTPGGTGTLAGFTFIPAPVIASFTPTSATIGATVTLTGTNFTGATAVSFGGTAATSFNVVSSTSITAVIAAGTSGNVSVTTPGGTGLLAGFTFIPAPVIASFTPTSAATGATVTLTGTNFTGATAVSFGGTAATSFNVVSATSITAVVAAGTSGNVSVTTPGGTGVLAGFTILSSNANLASLNLSTGTLSPVFASGTTNYTVSVPFESSSVTLSPTRSEGTASIKVNDITVTSGTASASIALALGTNTINTVVTAGDGTTTKTYSIVITREGPTVSSNAELSAISLSSGTLSPVFASGTTSYTATVPFATSSVTLTPTRSEGTASIKVNDVTVASGSASASIALAIGTNTISTIVTAGDGTTTKTYSIVITRTAGSSIANLSAMSISNGTLSPAFVPTNLDYVTFVNNNVSSITINPRSEQNNAVIKVNGSIVASQSNSGNIPLTIGSNTVNIVLTSEDGINQKTYTIKATRLRPEQILTDDSGNVTASNSTREIVVTPPYLPLNVNVPAGISAPITIAYSDLITAGKGTVPKTTITTPLAKIEIPASTQISASGTSWNGSFLAPIISSYDIPAKPGIVIKKGLIVEIGSVDFSLSFDKATRIVLFGEAGKKVSRVHGNKYEEILLTGPDTQVAGDALAANSSFKVDVGNDLVIWTKGLSRFITFTETEDLDVALVNADKNALTNDLIKGTNADLSSLTSAISLPSTGPNGSAITWVSSNPSVVSTDGKSISRPLFGSGDVSLTITATLTKGSITETKTFTITVLQLANQAPTLNAIANQTLCYTTASQTIALSGITPGPETSQTTFLSVSSSNSTLFSSLSVVAGTGGTAQLRFTPGNASGGTATVTVTVKDDGGTANGGADTFSRTFTISINPLPVINISSDLGTSISKGLTTELSASGGTSYTWSNAQGIISGQNSPILTVRPAATTTYTVTVSSATACINTQSITINVIDDYQALKVNNIMSPNGDGKNDLLIIKNLDMYPNNTLRIFNKAGRELFTKVNYVNDWDGTSNGSALVEDTYFYIVDFGQGLHKLKGFVSIVR